MQAAKWDRYVAVGDSFTEGVQDDVDEDGNFIGWADRLARAVAATHDGLEYANLAVRGKLLAQVVEDQVGPALAMEPDLVTFHAGGNDVLRPGVEVADIAEQYDEAVAALAHEARTLVLFTVLERSGAGGRMADRLAARIARFNDGVRATAARHGATLVDLARVPVMTDRRLWHVDRLHLGAHGHERVAAAVLEHLGIDRPTAGGPTWWRTPLPPAPHPTPLRRAADEAAWVRGHLAPWVWRRLRGVSSGDGRQPKRPEPAPLA